MLLMSVNYAACFLNSNDPSYMIFKSYRLKVTASINQQCGGDEINLCVYSEQKICVILKGRHLPFSCFLADPVYLCSSVHMYFIILITAVVPSMLLYILYQLNIILFDRLVLNFKLGIKCFCCVIFTVHN